MQLSNEVILFLTSCTHSGKCTDLPIFSIHGNHDDPTRDGNELLAALDLLSVSSLVNYFGRQLAVDKVEISPILLQKGDTKIALYGLGSLRDERLNRMWREKKVRFQRPGEGEWFSIFALHQNRDLGRGTKNCVHESMIPEWMDLIVWGHEHECLIEPVESVVGTFRISQPGSSVATSLTGGETIRKHVGFLDVRGSQFRMTPVPLLQVRSFMMGEVSLHGQGMDAEDPNIDDQVGAFLETEVKLLIHECKEKRNELLVDAKEQGNDLDEQEELKYQLEKPEQSLVRLKVEHSGFTTLNNQRFGARFVGLVGNPADLLLFHRKKETGGRAGVKKKKTKASLNTPIAPDDVGEMNIEALVKDNFDGSDKQMEIFDESKLTIALDEFVSKEIKQAMSEATKAMLKVQQKRLLARGLEGEGDDDDEEEDADMDEDGEEEEPTPKPKKGRRTAGKKAVDADMDEDEEEEEPIPKSKRGRRVAAKKTVDVDLDEDEEEEEEEEPTSKPKRGRGAAKKVAPTKKAAPASRKRVTPKRKPVVEDSEDEEEEDDDDFDEPPPPPKSRARAKRQTKPKAKNVESDDEDNDVVEILDDDDEEEEKPKKRKPPSSSRRRKRSSYADDDEDDAEFGNSYGVSDNWGSANTNSER